MPEHQGFGHVTLSVTDLERSADFYTKVFGTQSMPGEDEHGSFIVCVGQGLMVGLRKHQRTPDNESFDPFRVGMDHLGVAATES